MILLALLLQAAPATETPEARLERCADIAAANPAEGTAAASSWRLSGGGFLARQCLGFAYAAAANYPAAAGAFEEAARDAEVAKDRRSATLWSQAGNAWLAAGDPQKARAALDAALAGAALTGLALGETHLDRARALVAANETARARTDLDAALVHAAGDPLAWLLSATLARRTGDLPRARKDIAEALARAPDDASVQLEAGNISALDGDEPGARGGWMKAVQLAPDTPVGAAARTALAQFDAGK
ncbi:Tetratricopeptide repeat-containing protein [Sphingomonas guangdongensis]|uniref:Tetratricopeptide repeat-containing protein n=1 Tax=Sphingomonas guangdongensis TaxID=1141890 RepID=A0A285R2T4_9SPHN|nr:tetratricopeptide repeat protein [Sphingomonas guangdongensis]SOB86667.1 Tetratricopeptide repeat-containing protein [Sphingomonas guangdongensis]